MQVLKTKKRPEKVVLAVYYVIALVLMPAVVHAQQQKSNVTSTDFWKGVATNMVTFMKTMLAIAFWGSLALLLVYATVSWIGPTKFTRLGAVYDLIDTVKGWLLATFVIAAGIVGLITGFTTIVGVFGGKADINAVDVLTNLLIKPVTDLVGITK